MKTAIFLHLLFLFRPCHVEHLIVVVIQSNMTHLLRYIDHPSHLKPPAECVAVRKPFCRTARPKQCLGVAKCIDRSAQKAIKCLNAASLFKEFPRVSMGRRKLFVALHHDSPGGWIKSAAQYRVRLNQLLMNCGSWPRHLQHYQ